ncbi:transporter, partial [Sphingomonas echinoides]
MPHCHLRTSTTLIIVAAFAVAAPAHADPSDDFINPDRPGIADGSTTVGQGHFQIETAIQREYRSNGDEREHTTFIPTLLRYGFSKNWEFRVEGNTFTRQRQHDPALVDTDSSGFAPSSIGLKYNIVKAVGSTQPSIGAIVRVFPPSGSSAFRNSRATGDFRLAAV